MCKLFVARGKTAFIACGGGLFSRYFWKALAIEPLV
jgi:hypothetical protein